MSSIILALMLFIRIAVIGDFRAALLLGELHIAHAYSSSLEFRASSSICRNYLSACLFRLHTFSKWFGLSQKLQSCPFAGHVSYD